MKKLIIIVTFLLLWVQLVMAYTHNDVTICYNNVSPSNDTSDYAYLNIDGTTADFILGTGDAVTQAVGQGQGVGINYSTSTSNLYRAAPLDDNYTTGFMTLYYRQVFHDINGNEYVVLGAHRPPNENEGYKDAYWIGKAGNKFAGWADNEEKCSPEVSIAANDVMEVTIIGDIENDVYDVLYSKNGAAWATCREDIPGRLNVDTIGGVRVFVSTDNDEQVRVYDIRAYEGINCPKAAAAPAGDSTAPTYDNFHNNHSSPNYNDTINFSIELTDETNLSGYIFASNQTGTMINESFTAVTTEKTANLTTTLTINLTKDNFICGQYWFNDTSDNVAVSNLSCLTVVDTKAPTYTNFHNNHSSPKYNDTINFSIELSDAEALSGYIFASNQTGTMVNETYTASSATNVDETLLINITKDNYVCAQFWFNDTSDNPAVSNLSCLTVSNTPPNAPSGIVWITAGGFTSGTREYGQTLTSINATCTNGNERDLIGCNITVLDPNSVASVNNQPMGNLTETLFNYTQDVTLNGAGDWTIQITAYDGTDTTTTEETITVTRTAPTLFDGYNAYDYRALPTDATIKVDDTNFAYDTFGYKMNWTDLNTSYHDLRIRLNTTEDNFSKKSFVRFHFEGNYDPTDKYTNTTCEEVNRNLSDFAVAPYDETLIFLVISINETKTHGVNFTNKIAECLINATGNSYVIYSDYNNVSLDANWVEYYDLITITAQTNASLVTEENGYLRNSTALTRVYHTTPDNVRYKHKDYNDDVLVQIRGTPTTTPITNKSIAEISNGDLVFFNNDSTYKVFVVNVTNATRTNKDVWDSTTKTYIESDTDGIITVNLTAESFSNIYFADIDHLTLTEVVGVLSSNKLSYYWNGSPQNTGSWPIYGANDAMFYAHDPNYGQKHQFIIHYEWINTSYVTNYTEYCENGVVIIDDQQGKGINDTIGCLNSTYGYISVADYADNQGWEDNKTDEIDVWIDTYGINVFLDGLDTGATGNDFAIRFRRIADHIEVEKNKTCIANDYTSYATAGVGGVCSFDMKESFCGRWDGTVGSPTYSWETWSVDLARAELAATSNDPQLLMAFGNRLNTTKMMYCYSAYLVMYGTSGSHLYRYGQPNFQTQHEIYTYDPGTQLENRWTESNSSYYYRKYSNGKIWINPVDHLWGIDNNRVVHNITLSLYMEIYAGSAADSEGVYVNVNGVSLDPITYDEIGVAQWDQAWVKRNITALYDRNGKYAIRLHSTNPASAEGLNLWNSQRNRTGVFSFYESSVTNPPEDDLTSWTAYGRSGTNNDYITTNWLINLEMNDTTSATIDNGITDITQANITSYRKTNITITGTKDYSTIIWGNTVSLPGYRNISYWNGTVWKKVYPLNSTQCDTSAPNWNTTTIDGETHRACITNDGANTIVRVSPPSLSTQTYQVDWGNLAPTNPQIIYPVNNSNYTSVSQINLTSTDEDNDPITFYTYINDTLNYTSSSNSSSWNISDGSYSLAVSAYDGALFSSNTTISFIIDNTAPTIDSVLNRTTDDGTDTFYTNDNIYLNATVTDTVLGVYTVVLSYNDSSGNWYNQSATGSNNVYSYTLPSSNLSSAGNKYLGWRVYANDSLGNSVEGSINLFYITSLPSTSTTTTTGGGGGSAAAKTTSYESCLTYVNLYQDCFYLNDKGNCVQGCPENEVCKIDLSCADSSEVKKEEMYSAPPMAYTNMMEYYGAKIMPYFPRGGAILILLTVFFVGVNMFNVKKSGEEDI